MKMGDPRADEIDPGKHLNGVICVMATIVYCKVIIISEDREMNEPCKKGPPFRPKLNNL